VRNIKDCYEPLEVGEIIKHGNFFVERGWNFLETNNMSLASINNIISKGESSINQSIDIRSIDCYKRVKL